MNTLHIAMVTETYPPEINGVAMTVHRLVDGLRTRGQRVSLVRPSQPSQGAARVADDDECLVLGLPVPGYPGLNFGLARPRRLANAWRVARPDIVHVATEGPLGWAAMSAARSLGIPVVAGFHTHFQQYSRHYGVGWLRKPLAAYLRVFHNHARLTLVPTRSLAAQLADDGYRRLGIMSRGVDVELFRPQRRDAALRQSWGVGADDLALIHVGRLAPEKNLALLAEAFRLVQRIRPHSRLILVGGGPEAERLRHAHPEFVFAGPRTGEDLARHYASADVFVFPSLTETFGNVLFEAMASGLAVVAFDYAAAGEHLRHGENGLKARYGDEAAFVRLVAELAVAPATMCRLGEAARATTVGLAWEKVVDALEADYRRLLAGEDAGRGHALEGPAVASRMWR